MQWLSLLVVTFVLAGCAQPILVKDGMTPQQYDTDIVDCEQRVNRGVNQIGQGRSVISPRYIFDCMRAKGYREVTAEDYKRATTKQ